MNPMLLGSIVANAALAGAIVYFAFFANKPATSDGGYGRAPGGGGTAGPTTPGAVESLGRIQPTGGLISVFGPPGDKILRFKVAQGESVGEGTLLAELAGEDERKLSIDTLDAQIRESEALKKSILASRDAKLADIDAEAAQSLVGVDEDMKVIDAKVRAVDAAKDQADTDLRRLNEAKADGAPVAPQEIELVKLKVVQAEAERAGALAQKEKIVKLRENSNASIDTKKASVVAETNRALAALPGESLVTTRKLAERKQKDGQMLAPTAGRVLKLLAKPGDTLAPTQPAVQIANTARMSVLAEVYETDVGRIREWLRAGPVEATIDGKALGVGEDKPALRGTVANASKISSVIARNSLTPLGPREDTDRRVVEVEVELDPSSAKLVESFIGLQVRVRFEPRK